MLMAASEVPLALIDGELGRLVQGPAVTTWPRLQPAGEIADDDAPIDWGDIQPNQRFVPQSPPDPVDPEVSQDCLEDCGDDCAGCDCGCHLLEKARSGLTHARRILRDEQVQKATGKMQSDLNTPGRTPAARLLDLLQGENLTNLLDAVLDVDQEPSDDTSGLTDARRVSDAGRADRHRMAP